jgi:hypothetical protein
MPPPFPWLFWLFWPTIPYSASIWARTPLAADCWDESPLAPLVCGLIGMETTSWLVGTGDCIGGGEGMEVAGWMCCSRPRWRGCWKLEGAGSAGACCRRRWPRM